MFFLRYLAKSKAADISIVCAIRKPPKPYSSLRLSPIGEIHLSLENKHFENTTVSVLS